MKVIDLWGEQPPAEAHAKILSDPHRFVTLVAGRKFRKTSIGVSKLIKGAISTGLTYPYIAPYRKQAKEIVWYDHIPRLLNLFSSQGLRYQKNDSELFIRFPGGGRFKLDGSDNADALRGIGNWGGFVLGEYSDWKADVWEKIIRPNIITTKAWGMFEGTPKGFNQLHRMAKMGDHNGIIESGGFNEDIKLDPDFITYRFTSYDNPYLDPAEIEAAKRNTSPEFFNQEYLAKFSKFTGLVYKEFERETHVVEPFDIPDSWAIYRGIDFGSTNPTACLWIAVDSDDNFFIIDEHYESSQTIDYHAGVINSKAKRSIAATYGDPSGAQWISEFSQRGVYITPATKETNTSYNSWVRFGIEKVAEKLKLVPGRNASPSLSHGSSGGYNSSRGLPGLFVFSGCINTIREFETYRWKEKSVSQAQDLNEPDVPEKANDHCFTGDTMILTKTGWRRIDTIHADTHVWSPFGWNKIYRAGSTGIKKVKDYGVFKCTPDHKILTTRGLVEVDNLRYDDIIMSCVKQPTFKAYLTAGIQTPKTELIAFIFNALLIKSLMARRDFYTEMYGNSIKVKFLMAIWFIILTATLGITTSVILGLSLLATMQKSMSGAFGMAWRSILNLFKRKQKNGTGLYRGESGTLYMVRGLFMPVNGLLKYAYNAVNGTKHISPRDQDFAIKTVKPRRLEDAEVFNLATKFGCYFANGILVSNSMDALRYFAVSYSKASPATDLPQQWKENSWKIGR